MYPLYMYHHTKKGAKCGVLIVLLFFQDKIDEIEAVKERYNSEVKSLQRRIEVFSCI